MSEAIPLGELLAQSWRMFRTHLRTFVPLMGLPVAAVFLSTMAVFFFLVPIRAGVSPRDVWGDVWAGMSVARKTGAMLVLLANIALLNRVLVASIFAVREFNDGREIGVLRALGNVRRKHLRLFWLLFLAGLFSAGALGVVGLWLAFRFAPALPVAALEDVGVRGALRRSNALTKGGYGRITELFLLFLGLVVAGVFGLFGLLDSIQQFFGQAWFWRPVRAVTFWIILLIPQWYMIALTLNYFDQRLRKREWTPVAKAPP